MPDFNLGTLLNVFKHVLHALEEGDSKSPQVSGCGCGCDSKSPQVSGCGCKSQKTPDYVLTGLPVAIDTLIFKKIFLRPELDSKQLDALSSLFKDSDKYLHQLITLTDSIKELLPAIGAQDTNKQKRRQMVKKLETVMTKWSQNRQKELLKAYGVSGVIGAAGSVLMGGAMGTGGLGSTQSTSGSGATGSVEDMGSVEPMQNNLCWQYNSDTDDDYSAYPC